MISVSSRSHPAPMPKRNRPPLNRSSVETSFASSSGWRSGTSTMPVPSLMRVVTPDARPSATNGRLYGDVLPAGGRLLDLMSSWRTHLPDGFDAREVVGLGLNAEEMADNPQLTSHVVHDLNRDPRLPFADETFDGAICAVSIQYMTHPVTVF